MWPASASTSTRPSRAAPAWACSPRRISLSFSPLRTRRRAGVRREFRPEILARDVRPRVAELLRIEAGADDLSLDIRRQLPIPYPARREFLDGTLSDIGFRQKPRQSPVSRVPSSIEFTGFTLLPDNTSALTSSGWRYAYSVAA